jgi:hypothetical protein
MSSPIDESSSQFEPMGLKQAPIEPQGPNVVVTGEGALEEIDFDDDAILAQLRAKRLAQVK